MAKEKLTGTNTRNTKRQTLGNIWKWTGKWLQAQGVSLPLIVILSCLFSTLISPSATCFSMPLRSLFLLYPSLLLLCWKVGKGELNREKLTRILTGIPAISVLLFATWSFSPSVIAALSGDSVDSYAWSEVIRLATGVVICICAVVSLRNVRQAKGVFLLTCLAGLIIAGIGIGDFLLHNLSPARGGFGNKQLLGGFLSCLLPITAAYTMTSKHRLKWFGMIAAIAILFCLIVTGNRTSIFAALGGVGVVLILLFRESSLHLSMTRINGAVLKIIATTVLLATFVAYLASGPLRDRLTSESFQRGLRPRIEWCQAGLRIIRDNPIAGCGLGAYPKVLKNYLDETWSIRKTPSSKDLDVVYLNDEAHNEYVQIAAESGLVGLILHLAILIGFFVSIYRAYRRLKIGILKWLALALMGGMVAYSLDALANPAWRFGYVSCVFWLMAGWGIGICQISKNLLRNEKADERNAFSSILFGRAMTANVFLVVLSVIAFANSNGVVPGYTYENDPKKTAPDDEKAKPEPEGCGKGMATYNFHTMLASLNIMDTPVGYNPPYGPSMPFTLTYNQREATQPAVFNYTNFGPKWNMSWITYMTDFAGPADPYERGTAGGGKLQIAYLGTSGGYKQYTFVGRPAVRLSQPSVALLPYEVTNADGSKEIYGQPDNGSFFRKVFLTQRVDPSGNITTLSYDSQTRITSITDALGQQTIFSYGLAADPLKVTRITDPFGRFATFDYDSSGRLVRITDVIGIQSNFSYEGSSDFINSMTTPYGITTFTNTVNGNTRRVTATDPAGDTEVLESNALATLAIPNSESATPQGMTVYNADLQKRNSFFWDKKQWKDAPNDYTKAHIYHWLIGDNGQTAMSGFLESEKPPLENRIWYSYPGQTNPQITGSGKTRSKVGRVIEGGTQLVNRTVSSLDQITSETDPIGRITNYTYSADGRDLTGITQNQSAGTVTLGAYVYNSQRRPLTYTDAAGQVTTYTWNSVGQITSLKNAKNETTSFSYYPADATGKQRKGRLQTIDGPLSGASDTVTMDYDAYGNTASVTGPDGYTLAFTYDALDRPVRVTYPDGTYTETAYFRLDPVTSRDRLGRMTQYTYNSVRQLISVIDPLNRQTQYDYCDCGSLSQLTDALGRITIWSHDVAGRVTQKRYVDGSTINYAYEPLSGRLSSTTDEKNQVKTRSYNLDDTLAANTYTNSQNPTPNVSFTYDPYFRRLASMIDGLGLTTYTYKPFSSGTFGAGQLATIDGPWNNDTIAYSYDELGRQTSRSINGVAQTTAFDSAGRLSNITNPLGTFTYGYDGATSRLASATHDGGLKTLYDYFQNAQDRRLQRIRNLKPDGITPLSVCDYTYDAQGRILTWKQQQDTAVASANTWTLGYDNADQLTSNVITQGVATVSTSAWEYDKAANRTKETLNGTAAISSYNTLNQLTNTEASLPAATYEWDAENRLIAINQGNNRSEFTYDGYGRRVKIVEKTNNTITSADTYLWCNLEECEKRDAAGSVVQQRYFAQGFQGVTGSPAGPHLYMTDHLGSIREIVDTTGLLKERISYDAWGKSTFSNLNPISSFSFTGHFLHINSSLNLAPFRAYDPTLGRWLSRDPIEEMGGSNLYGYASNKPEYLTDPLGLDTYDAFERVAAKAYGKYGKYGKGTKAVKKVKNLSENLVNEYYCSGGKNSNVESLKVGTSLTYSYFVDAAISPIQLGFGIAELGGDAIALYGQYSGRSGYENYGNNLSSNADRAYQNLTDMSEQAKSTVRDMVHGGCCPKPRN